MKNGLKWMIGFLIVIVIILFGVTVVLFEKYEDVLEDYDELKNPVENNYNYDTNDNSVNNNSVNNDDNDVNNNDSNNYITKEKALQIVLDDTKISRNDIYDLDIELDYKYNTNVYEISFNYQKHEYEYYLEAKTGKILHHFKELD